LPQFIVAPVQKGQVVAKVLIQKEGKIVKEVNLLASSGVEKSLIPPGPSLSESVVGLRSYWYLDFGGSAGQSQKTLNYPLS